MERVSARASAGCECHKLLNFLDLESRNLEMQRTIRAPMGTFDEAKKLFPPPRPEHDPPKPKEKPQPLILGRAMQFNGVVGRSSLPIPTTMTNPNHERVRFDVESTAPEFQPTMYGGELDNVQAGDNTATVSVKYAPTKPGTTHGLLHIMSRFVDEAGGERSPAIAQDLELVGTATELAHPKAAPSDGSPRAIPDLEQEDKQLAPRQRIENDLDALSGLAETYKTIVGANDEALSKMIRHIYHAKFEFETQIKQWVQAELGANKVEEASATHKLAWSAIAKAVGFGIEKLELGSVVGLVVGHVVDAGFDRLSEYLGEDHQAKSKEAAANSASESGAALEATTDETVRRRLGVLNGRIDRSRAEAGQLAGVSAMIREGQAQQTLAENRPYESKSTAAHINEFKDALGRYSDACRALAATSTQIEASLKSSFDALRMNYLRERAAKTSDLAYNVEYAVAWDLGTDDSNGRETFRAFEPKISGFDRVSEPMRNFITHRRLSDYAADANVTVRVNCKQGGYVVIEKRPGADPTFKEFQATAAVRATMRGAPGFWSLLEEQIK